jgi:hypothetical protein
MADTSFHAPSPSRLDVNARTARSLSDVFFAQTYRSQRILNREASRL